MCWISILNCLINEQNIVFFYLAKCDVPLILSFLQHLFFIRFWRFRDYTIIHTEHILDLIFFRNSESHDVDVLKYSWILLCMNCICIPVFVDIFFDAFFDAFARTELSDLNQPEGKQNVNSCCFRKMSPEIYLKPVHI